MVRGFAYVLLGSGSLLLMQCTPVLQGPPVDVATFGKPDLLPETAPKTGPTPASMPPLASGAIRAWVPRTVSANGDVVEGHYLDISPTAPRQETVAPAKPIPRPPKGALPQAPQQAKRKPQDLPPPMAPRQAPMPPHAPGFPSSTPFPIPGGDSYEPLVP